MIRNDKCAGLAFAVVIVISSYIVPAATFFLYPSNLPMQIIPITSTLACGFASSYLGNDRGMWVAFVGCIGTGMALVRDYIFTDFPLVGIAVILLSTGIFYSVVALADYHRDTPGRCPGRMEALVTLIVREYINAVCEAIKCCWLTTGDVKTPSAKRDGAFAFGQYVEEDTYPPPYSPWKEIVQVPHRAKLGKPGRFARGVSKMKGKLLARPKKPKGADNGQKAVTH